MGIRPFFEGGVTWGDGTVRHVGLFANHGGNTEAPEVEAAFHFFELKSLPGKEETSETNSETPPPEVEAR